MKRENIIKELEKKLGFSKKEILVETVCMPEWPTLPEKKIKKESTEK